MDDKISTTRIYNFFYSLLFRDASTSFVISRLGSSGVCQKAVYFYCCVVNVSFVKFTDFNFMIYECESRALPRSHLARCFNLLFLQVHQYNKVVLSYKK